MNEMDRCHQSNQDATAYMDRHRCAVAGQIRDESACAMYGLFSWRDESRVCDQTVVTSFASAIEEDPSFR
jgi:hypothetical protein